MIITDLRWIIRGAGRFMLSLWPWAFAGVLMLLGLKGWPFYVVALCGGFLLGLGQCQDRHFSPAKVE